MIERQIVNDILNERYFQPGEKSWCDISRRVAEFVGQGKKKVVDEYYDVISQKKLIPNSPALMNAGTDTPQLSACFSVNVEDSIDSIFDGVKACAIIHKSGGGTGINFSKIRGKGSEVKGTGHMASGPVSFMHVFNEATETIKQGGKRRGANLGSLDITHPDIKEFITCKHQEGELSNFNISVNITDEFMRNKDAEVFNLIVDGIWRNGEPGIIFTDSAEKDNKRPDLGKLEHTNPCGETRLLAWESCNLASINLMSCMRENYHFDMDEFKRLVCIGVRFLNHMLDVNEYPLRKIAEATRTTRKIGLGVMGFADVLISLRLRYGSQKSLDFADMLFSEMRKTAEVESKRIMGHNAALLSIAPTGSISIFANVSSGIEPNFSYVYQRSTWASGEKKSYIEYHPLFKEEIHKLIPQSDVREIIYKYMLKHGTLKGCVFTSPDIREIFVTAKDISPKDHVIMQGVIQKHIDQAISKTINCSESTTKEEIGELIELAWVNGCKGLTIYRESSRLDVVLETTSESTSNEQSLPDTHKVMYGSVTDNYVNGILQLPQMVDAIRIENKSGCGDIRVIVSFHHGNPVEVFAIGENGGCKSNIEAIGRLLSTALRGGIAPEVLERQMHEIKCSSCMRSKDADGNSCGDIIGKSIRAAIKKYNRGEYIESSQDMQLHKPVISHSGVCGYEICPECGLVLIHHDGCKSCTCGYTKCK